MLTSTLLTWFGRRPKAGGGSPDALLSGPVHPRGAGGDLIFRLKSWPQLPEAGRTAEIYRILSVMSNQPVNRQWLLARCRMAPSKLDRLLRQLEAEGSLEVIDPARFAGREARA